MPSHLLFYLTAVTDSDVSSQINREKALHTLVTLDHSRHAKFTILSPWCSQVLSDELLVAHSSDAAICYDGAMLLIFRYTGVSTHFLGPYHTNS